MDFVFDTWDLSELDDIMGKNPNTDDVYSVADSTTMNNWNEQDYSMISSSSSKKPQIHGNEQHVSCLVDGCMEDLSDCRDYHRRHRVCENHSKSPVVKICGQEQRFCQQCSRFHSVGEFDEVKRSCRKRLEGHNRRRRKPRADSMFLNYGSFFTNHQGTKVLRFDGSPAYTTTFAGWPDTQNLNNQKPHVTVEDSPPAAHFCSPTARKRKFPFLLDTEYDKVNQPLTQVINTNASLAHLVVEPRANGALSLLSKNTIHHHHHASKSGQTNLVHPSGSALQFNGPLIQHLDPSKNVTRPNIDDQLIGMIHFRAQGLLENEAAQLLSFSWE